MSNTYQVLTVAVFLVSAKCSTDLKPSGPLCQESDSKSLCHYCEDNVLPSSRCCYDSLVYSLCRLAQQLDGVLQEVRADELNSDEVGKRAKGTSKLFLGKRYVAGIDGDLEKINDEKRANKGTSKLFLGKREEDTREYVNKEEDKRSKGEAAKPFLGKRELNIDSSVDNLENNNDDKRYKGGATKPFLGKREIFDNDEEKRAKGGAAKPFLGKREMSNVEEKRARASKPFLGKREMSNDEEKRARASKPFLGKREMSNDEEKRARASKPFLDKREMSNDEEKRAKSGASKPFLGKREIKQESNAALSDGNLDSTTDEGMDKRAKGTSKLFLGKRSTYHLDKRPRNTFLGKRMSGEDWYYDMKKRPQPFLGKRNLFVPVDEDEFSSFDKKGGRNVFLG